MLSIPSRIAAGLAVVLIAVVYVLRLDRVVGLVVDDAWYVLLARTLAEGRGFLLVGSPATPILPSAPPGFPAILSLVFRFQPQFPDNLWMLKAVSVGAMTGAGALINRYFVRYRGLPQPLAGGIAVATMLSPGLVFLATSTVMPECVFIFSQLFAVVLVERAVHTTSASVRLRLTIVAAVLTAAA